MLLHPLLFLFQQSIRKSFSLFSSAVAEIDPPASITNEEKLMLPYDTVAGTQVTISDWESAGLSGPVQQLLGPSEDHAGVFIYGSGYSMLDGTVNGIYTLRETGGSERGNYVKLGSPSFGSISAIWYVDNLWTIYDSDGDAKYVSGTDAPTPAGIIDWATADTSIVDGTSSLDVTLGELNAGADIGGSYSGTFMVDAVSGPNEYKNTYRDVHAASDDVMYWLNNRGSTSWDLVDPDPGPGSVASSLSDTAFPWMASWGLDGITVSRNDVASEANWERVT